MRNARETEISQERIPLNSALALRFFEMANSLQIIGGPHQSLIRANVIEKDRIFLDNESQQLTVHLQVSKEDLALLTELENGKFSISSAENNDFEGKRGRCGFKQASFVDKGNGHIVVTSAIRQTFKRGWKIDESWDKRRTTRQENRDPNNILAELVTAKNKPNQVFRIEDISQHGIGISTAEESNFQKDKTINLNIVIKSDEKKTHFNLSATIRNIREINGATHLGLEFKNLENLGDGLFEKLKGLSDIFASAIEATNATTKNAARIAKEIADTTSKEFHPKDEAIHGNYCPIDAQVA